MTKATGANVPTSTNGMDGKFRSVEPGASLFDRLEERLQGTQPEAVGAAPSPHPHVKGTSGTQQQPASTMARAAKADRDRFERQRELAATAKYLDKTAGFGPLAPENGQDAKPGGKVAKLARVRRSRAARPNPDPKTNTSFLEADQPSPSELMRVLQESERISAEQRGTPAAGHRSETSEQRGSWQLLATDDLHVESPPLPFAVERVAVRESRFGLSRRTGGALALALIASLAVVAVVFVPEWRGTPLATDPQVPEATASSPAASTQDFAAAVPSQTEPAALPQGGDAESLTASLPPQAVASTAPSTSGDAVASLSDHSVAAGAVDSARAVASSQTEAAETAPAAPLSETGGRAAATLVQPSTRLAVTEVPRLTGQELAVYDHTTLVAGPTAPRALSTSVGETMVASDVSGAPGRVDVERFAGASDNADVATVGGNAGQPVLATVARAAPDMTDPAVTVASLAATANFSAPAATTARNPIAAPDTGQTLRPRVFTAIAGTKTGLTPALVALVVPPSGVEGALAANAKVPSMSGRVTSAVFAPSGHEIHVEPSAAGRARVLAAQPEAESGVASETIPLSVSFGPGDVVQPSALTAHVPDSLVLPRANAPTPLTGTVVPDNNTRISLYAPGSVSDDEMTVMAAVLEGAGYDLKTAARVNFTISKSNVRYYHAEDAAAAASLADASGATLRDFTAKGSTAPPGTVELWLAGNGGGAVAAAPKPARAAPVKRKPNQAATNRTAKLRSQVIEKLRRATSQ